jgi:hypothetical protein
MACQALPLPGIGKWQQGGDPWADLPNLFPQTRNGVEENCPLAFKITGT